MEKKVFENKFIQFVFDEEKRLMKYTWGNTIGLFESDFKEIMGTQTEYLLRFKPQFLLIDNTNFSFPIDPELQEWVNEQCLAQWRTASPQKIALTSTKEIIAQLSLEQIWEEPIGRLFNVQFFDNVEEVQWWLRD
ncbi:hypothetical protein BKI52_44380 [marine bacterium AO1-C]|nr:hypothetical protein BKI52_44380 [marine bacterium AO1-C]